MKGRARSRLSRRVTLSVLVVSIALIAAACSKSSNTGTGSNSPTSAAGGKDATIAAEVPPAIATKGTLTVATDASYAPNEFVDPTSQQIMGMDVDLGQALATVMGLKATFVNAKFDNIIPGLASGKFDLGMSSFTDTLERQKTVDFVTYFSAGTSFYTAASGGPTVTGLSSLCGLKVGVESGTTQETDVNAQSRQVHRRRESGSATVDLRHPGCRQPRAVQRAGPGRHGGLTRRCLRGEAVLRRLRACRDPLRNCAVRDRDPDATSASPLGRLPCPSRFWTHLTS